MEEANSAVSILAELISEAKNRQNRFSNTGITTETLFPSGNKLIDAAKEVAGTLGDLMGEATSLKSELLSENEELSPDSVISGTDYINYQ